MERIETETAIVGGGIAGCATALYLARRNVPVVLLEKGFAGAQASGVNFGGVRRQGRHLAELPLAERARAIWPRLAEVVGDACEYAVTGHLKLAMSDAELAELDDYARAAKPCGLDLEVMGGEAARRRFPWLGEAIAGASWCPGDGSANPRLVGPAFARAARGAGAEVREQAEAVAFDHDGAHFTIVTENGLEVRARRLVNAAGAWGGEIAAAFGEPVPIAATAPQMVVTEPGSCFIAPVLGMCGTGIYLRQIPRGNVVFGGGRGVADTGASRSYVLPEATLATGALALRIIPRLAGLHIIRVWTGIEGEMPDAIPVIGPSRTTPGLFHAFGFSGHGFQLGPVMGEILGELVLNGETESPIDAFDIGRFAGAGCRG
ncbi:MAG: FAD-binding oxidoreductase [Alphaproteobacteria bacterium]